ncbi:MAG: heavy metal sensor histidine kinase [Candidatus Sumerlaeia bacterium]|nr:heavy metal sensor histidine kinase [Candidatus Sumerlaeia bacterium]
MRLFPQSIRWRLTLWFGLTLALILAAFSAGIYTFVHTRLLKQLDGQLGKEFAAVKRILREEPAEIVELEEDGIALASVSEGSTLVHRTNDWRRAELDKAIKSGGTRRPGRPWSWARGERSYRLMADSVRTDGRTFHVAVAVDARPIRRSLRTLALMLATGFPCALVLAMVGGYFLAGRLLAPVGAMAAKAREITADRLAERLPVVNPADEFGRLATVFNETLGRLEDAFERLKRFTADASHELRTPLTAIRSVGEVALQEPLDVAAARDAIGSMLEEADRLSRLVDNLLVLTRADSGRVSLAVEPLDLAALLRDVADCLGVLAEEKNQTVEVEIAEPLTVEADRITLRMALINLLDNAIRYTPSGGRIRLVVRRMGDRAAIEVADTGPGIPPEHREKVFERFYRVGLDRSSETGGAGLGLAIARWAVEINGGRIELESEEGRGSTFRILLPERKGGETA